MPESQPPKIIIDDDWKTQAQAEKERLSQKVDAEGPAKGGGDREQLKFQDLVGMLATQALSYLGYVPDPQTGQAMVSLEYARLYIDLLGILEEKTKGNLTGEEGTALTRTVGELRSAFVETSQAVAKAVKEGRIRPAGGAGAASPGAPASPIITPDSGT